MDVIIDGDRYIKQTECNESIIGIGITTHNRNQLVADTVARIKSVTPNAYVVVVDDASERPVVIDGVVVYRFKTNVGIARAKNKCLELLSNCDHIFLFDDDTYPIKAGWYLPYINSPEHHLMYLFKDWANGQPVGDDAIIYKDDTHQVHQHARGCMLYVDALALATVGGMDTRYGKAMNEHLDWSIRIHNAGLTTFKYMDVVGSNELIYSSDEHQAVSSSIVRSDRRLNLEANNKLLLDNANSSAYCSFGKDVVIACYFANVADVQRNNTSWKPELAAIDKLKRSVEAHGIEFILIHNCFDLPNKVTISKSPYFERWLKEWQYLRDRRDISNVFLVDATDVDMIINPFNNLKNDTLYIGDEPNNKVNSNWMLTRHLEPSVNKFIREGGNLPLLNCGVVGGNRKLVMELCRDIYQYHFECPQDQTEMGIFNKLVHTKYAHLIEYGRHVTSIFKGFERHTNAWFRHK